MISLTSKTSAPPVLLISTAFMKAVEISKTGGAEVLEVKDITLDKPGSDEVTIE